MACIDMNENIVTRNFLTQNFVNEINANYDLSLSLSLSLSDFLACSPDDSAPVILFVSKLFAMEKADLPQHQSR